MVVPGREAVTGVGEMVGVAVSEGVGVNVGVRVCVGRMVRDAVRVSSSKVGVT